MNNTKNLFKLSPAQSVKIQDEFKQLIVEAINGSLFSIKNENILAIYVRGSLSCGKGIKDLSDLDLVIITRTKLSTRSILWIIPLAARLERKYPFVSLVDLTVVSEDEILSDKYLPLRTNLITKSLFLLGQDIVKEMPRVIPDRNLTLKLNENLITELKHLRKIFSDRNSYDKAEYQFRTKPYKFWCVWLCRTFIRSGFYFAMPKAGFYTQDLLVCGKYFATSYPEMADYVDVALKWSIYPISSKKDLVSFIDNIIPKLKRIIKAF